MALALQDRDDKELLDAWRGGNLEAASLLFERHFVSIERFFRTKVHGGLEDLVQATFLACVEGHDGIRNASQFRAYLFGIARRQLLQHFKQKKRTARFEADAPVSALEALGTSPSVHLGKRRQTRQLLQAIRAIPLDLQIALELYYWEHFSTEEVAGVLDIPSGTVRNRLHRAREMLRAELGSSEGATLISTLDSIRDWVESMRRAVPPAPSGSSIPALSSFDE